MKMLIKELRFLVQGNQEDKKGNPMGYFRTTQNSFWTKGAKRYANWKDYVRKEFAKIPNLEPRFKGEKTYLIGKKNIVKVPYLTPLFLDKNESAEIDLKVYVKGNKHADADNILKGVLDALFFNDKRVYKQTVELIPEEPVGKIEATIKIYEGNH